ncbi:Npun_F0296 family exosortase-dependent surface protein [Polymorphobacter sp.]|uniref:Npun_F0296 family exosortase-dependent surface protein n=1 Tax=Polymorphobacter sp. TaxID=1909290 RepID=UPI003F725167
MFARLVVAMGAASLMASAASAIVVVSSVAGAPDPGVPNGFATVVTFDSASAPGIVNTFTGAVTTAAGNISGVRAAPAGTPQGGVYQSVGTGGASTFDFTGYLGAGQALTGLTLYWGSVDAYNFLDFLAVDGTVVRTLSGSDLPMFNGNQTMPDTNRRLTFAMDARDNINRLVFRSDGNAFEFDTIAVAQAAVPEPASWALLIAGFGLVGAVMRRRQRVARVLA